MAEISEHIKRGTPEDAFMACVAAIDFARKENPRFLLGKGDRTVPDKWKYATGYKQVLLIYQSQSPSDVDTLHKRLSDHFGLGSAPRRPGVPGNIKLELPPFYLFVAF